ncbi:hypothetical protein LXM94_13640 [Rhizobium sp. TRM95111]|uniref:hypothetical protein n=1 Tax=Rhizobium alarense TaxID=2846851 RepID=UPI001F469F15|nr:hypothetical protein [Rhizobium alarense]MCF3641015.1 hypothetical protein [Rhizobium alarense]
MGAFRFRSDGDANRVDLIPPTVRNAAIARPQHRFEVVDAHFVVLVPPSDRRPRQAPNDNRRGSVSTDLAGRTVSLLSLGAATAARLAERLLQMLPAQVFTSFVLILSLTVFLVCGGFSLLREAIAGRAAPLEIVGLSHVVRDRDGMKVITVRGGVRNNTSGSLAVPDLLVAIDRPDAALSTRVTSAEAVLPAGGERRFTVTLPYAGGALPKVTVSLISADAKTR